MCPRLCLKKRDRGAPRLRKARNPTWHALQGVKPGSFVKPTEACAFLHVKMNHARTLWKKVIGEREKEHTSWKHTTTFRLTPNLAILFNFE